MKYFTKSARSGRIKKITQGGYAHGRTKRWRLADSFTCSETHNLARSVLINDSDLELTESTVNNALAAFTERTGIPVVIVVEDMTDVFDGSVQVGSIVILLALTALMVLSIVNVIRGFRENRVPEEPYQSFDDQN